jgi:ferredoxin
MKRVRKIIEIDEERCDGCGQCVISCAEGALAIVDGKARLISEVYCDGLGACLGECPQGALKITSREADEFDPEAVEAFLEQKGREEPAIPAAAPSGCPSAQLRTFEVSCDEASRPAAQAAEGSALSHWPVQIRLIPPTAPFLKGRDILVAADCVPVAYPHFHADFLQGKAVLIGCPKFDNIQEYLSRFTEIFRTAEIRSVTVLTMEVPCCSGLPTMLRKAMEAAGRKVPMEEIVISSQGKVLERNRCAA